MKKMEDAPDITEQVLAIISKEGLVGRETLTPQATLDSLGIASADMMVILLAIEEQFDIYIPVDSDLSEIKTVGQLTTELVKRIRGTK
jgi:acyl carrier protein